MDGNWYYKEADGSKANGWKLLDGKWYYLESDGHMATGWKRDNKWYYLNPEKGDMLKGWQEISGSWYYLESSGEMATGWKEVEKTSYYLEKSGSMVIGEVKIDDNICFFNNSGRLEYTHPTSQVTTLNEKGKVNIDSLEVKSGPYFKANTIYNLEYNDIVTIVEKLQGEQEWYKIKTNSFQGYVLAKDIKLKNEIFTKDAATTDGKKTKLYCTWSEGELWSKGKAIENCSYYEPTEYPEGSFEKLLSFLMGFTQLDIPKDLADLAVGKDIITGEKINRGVLFACLFLPEVADVALKKVAKNSDKIIESAKNLFKMDEAQLKKVTKEAIEKDGKKFEEVRNEVETKFKAEIDACFTENTLVYTKNGLISIKNIKIGDKVYSENTYTKEITLKKVKNTFIKDSNKLIYIHLKNDIIKTTENHPFYVEDKGWISAGTLTENDKLRCSDGTILNINKIEIKLLENSIKVYNFEVEDWHNYFVGKNKILVHNNCKQPILTTKDIPTANSGDFNKFFNSLTVDEVDELWKNKNIRKKIERQLRHPGGLHEWHLVSRTPQFKHWGITAEQIKELRSAISNVKFKNPSGIHGGLGSTKAHNELLDLIDSSNDYNSFVRKLNNWANYRLEGGINSLPQGLRIKIN